MTSAKAQRAVMVAWIVALGVITWRELRADTMPKPCAYVGTGIIYGGAAVIAELAPALGAALGVAWTLGLVYGSMQLPRSTKPAGGGGST